MLLAVVAALLGGPACQCASSLWLLLLSAAALRRRRGGAADRKEQPRAKKRCGGHGGRSVGGRKRENPLHHEAKTESGELTRRRAHRHTPATAAPHGAPPGVWHGRGVTRSPVEGAVVVARWVAPCAGAGAVVDRVVCRRCGGGWFCRVVGVGGGGWWWCRRCWCRCWCLPLPRPAAPRNPPGRFSVSHVP